MHKANMPASSSAAHTVVVGGAASQIGRFLLPLLVDAGYRAVALSRRSAPEWKTEQHGNVAWHKVDNWDTSSLTALPAAHSLIHLAPLTILPHRIEAFLQLGIKRIIAFSSSSKFSKAGSPSAAERAFAHRLNAAEDELAENCRRFGMHWTIFRPTLIYGRDMDRNITLIRRLVRATGIFPILGEASGLRQPVHAADLANACVVALDNPLTFEKTYDLSGGETLTYRAMVSRIFESLNYKPRFVTIPKVLYGTSIAALSFIPGYRDFNIAMAQRMNEDLVCEHTEATRDFGYQPRRFVP
ncbi:MAG: NAD-dependent epimerase/dehydratase family protein [Sterolibacterium sp.]